MTSRKLPILAGLSLLAAAGLSLAPEGASARSQPAILGNPQYGTDANCFDEDAGGPKQVRCGAKTPWVIPLVYDNAGVHTVRVLAAGAGSGTRNVSCRAFSTTMSGDFSAGNVHPQDRTIRNDGKPENIYAAVYAHGFGGTWATCWMDQGTRLINVHY